MDPAIEVSTLVVSYLWALRDLYPEAEFVRDCDVTAEAADPAAGGGQRSSRTLADRLGALGPGVWVCDYALLARLQNIARRLDDQRWGPSAAHPTSAADLDAVVDEAFKKRLARSMARLARKGAPEPPLESASHQSVARHLRSGVNYLQYLREYYAGKVAGGSDYRAAAEEILLPFARHAAALVACFGHVRIRDAKLGEIARDDGPALTREGLTEAIALALLENDLLRQVSIDLEYRPVLLRTSGPESDETRAMLQALLGGPDYPKPLIAYCEANELALPFPLVLHRELDEIERSRYLRRGERPPPYAPTLASRRAYDRCLLGVALSGGGIRSATFSLGMLQGLSTRGWLPQIDYLSTVSGGGYIGAWLLAWIKRRGSVQAVQESLRGYAAGETSTIRSPDPGSEHVRPIRLLREFSNYLAPQSGMLSADTWTMISIWVRNTGLNLLTLTLFAMAVLLAPQMLGLAFAGRDLDASVLSTWLCVWLAALFIGLNLQSFEETRLRPKPRSLWTGMFFVPTPATERGDTTLIVITTIVVPALAAAFYATRALWTHDEDASHQVVFGASFVALAVGIVISVVASRPFRFAPRGFRRLEKSPWNRLLATLATYWRNIPWGVLAAGIGAGLVVVVHRTVLPILHADSRRGMWIALAFGPSAMLGIAGVVIVLYLGFQGRAATEEHREWWSRLGAWLGLIAIGWSLLACISYFAPYGVAATGLYAGTLGVGWTLFTAVGAWLASSGKSNGVNLPFDKNPVLRLIIAITPYLFILGFLVLVAVLGHVGLYLLQGRTLPFSLTRYVETYWAFLDPESWIPITVCVSLLLAAAFLARRVDINEFSMHHFYKNRLVRAYLGASRARVHRRPNAFTGFDMDDDIKLWRFRHDDPPLPNDASNDCRAGFRGPFPIINTTLNLTSGDELAWQERKGQSFVFTPLYCGYDFATKQTGLGDKITAQFGYRPTRVFGNGDGRPRGDPDAGLGIGTAIAISGAAANPNAGHHTSPAVAFMLTLFNARLGWWMGNPRLQAWKRESPRFGLIYLLSELFGFSGVHRQYVNLSDGGHFENMGLYELVRRRCRYIIVCDGEQDDRYSFNGMAGAIRKCRIDFGVVIDLSMEAIARRTEDGRNSTRHAAVGTVTYPGHPPGVIVYLKASLTGDEPADVREYRQRQPEFPHQPTSDQFFDESQFESYRALGQHIADDVFPAWNGAADDPCGQLHSLMKRVRERCESP